MHEWYLRWYLFFQKKLFFFFFFVVEENKAHVTERCVREWERESSHLWYPYSLQGSAPESNFSASGISFPRISWPKARLPSPDSRKADGPGLQTYSTCGGPYWKKKQKTKDLTVYCVAQRQTGAERPHSWMDGRASRTHRPLTGRNVRPCSNPPRRRAVDRGRKDRRGEAPLELVSAVVALTLMKTRHQQRASDLASGSNSCWKSTVDISVLSECLQNEYHHLEGLFSSLCTVSWLLMFEGWRHTIIPWKNTEGLVQHSKFINQSKKTSHYSTLLNIMCWQCYTSGKKNSLTRSALSVLL